VHNISFFKKLSIYIISITATCLILNLPILAQESSKPPSDQSQQTPAVGEAGAPPEGAIPGTETGTPVLSNEEYIAAALMAYQLKQIKIGRFKTPNEFLVKDYPNDGGSAFVVMWPLTEGDKAEKEKEKAGYLYRVYHSTGKYNVSFIKTESAKLNHNNINALVDFINSKTTEEFKFKTYYNILLISEGDGLKDRQNLNNLIAFINAELKKANEGKKTEENGEKVSQYQIVFTKMGTTGASWDDFVKLMEYIDSNAGEEEGITKKEKKRIRKEMWEKKKGEQIEVYKTNSETLVHGLQNQGMEFVQVLDLFKDSLTNSQKDNRISVFSTQQYDIATSIAVNPQLPFAIVVTNYETLLDSIAPGDQLLIYSTNDEELAKSISGTAQFNLVVVEEKIPKLNENKDLKVLSTYADVPPGSSLISSLKTTFWDNVKQKDKKLGLKFENIQAYKWEVPVLPVLDKKGKPRIDPEEQAIVKPDYFNKHYFQMAVVELDDKGQETRETRFGDTQMLVATSNPLNKLRGNNILMAFVYCFIILWFISHAKKGKQLFIRKIAGLDAVDEAIGRATEMGRPILYLTGLDGLSTVATIAAVNILGQVAKKVADYDSQIINPHRDPVVMSVCQEVVKEAYINAGRPDAYNPDNIFFLTDDQFSYVAAIDGIMVREKPATNIFMGYYYAESLILAETGGSTGAIQIAGTDSLAQLPFFITTCDYTLIGEELYAASAYLSREPLLLGSLKGQDVGKLFFMVMLIIGVLIVTIPEFFPDAIRPLLNFDFIKQIFQAQ